MKHVISISLGSSQRNRSFHLTFANEQFHIERIGVDGNVHLAEQLIAQRDGKVDAIGLGGVDRWLYAGRRRYELRDAARMARAARHTPVVDGGGIKLYLEPLLLGRLVEKGELRVAGARVLIMSAVDRPGMAEAFPSFGAHVIYGDLIYAVGIPIAFTSLRQVAVAAALFLPLLRRLPMSVLYPTGRRQETTHTRYARYFTWADIIAGDFQFIHRYMPDKMAGKIIVTNTTRANDVELLRRCGVGKLITITPSIAGESFGANLMEAVLVAISGKRPEELTANDYIELADRVGWQPNVTNLTIPAVIPESS